MVLPAVEVSSHTLLNRDHAISVLSQRHGPYLCRNLWRFYIAYAGYVSTNVEVRKDKNFLERKWRTSICLREIGVELERCSIGEDSSGIDSKQTATRFPLTSIRYKKVDQPSKNVELPTLYPYGS
jgi:hypothetical protein